MHVREVGAQPPGVFGMGDGLGGIAAGDAEVQPPHGDRAGERGQHGRDHFPAPVLDFTEHAAGGQQGFAQRHDDEQLAALGQMPALDGPVTSVRTAHAREREAEHRRDVLAGHRHRPQRQPQRAIGCGTGQPEARRNADPGQHAAEVGRQRMVTTDLEQDESRAPHLHRGVGPREHPGPVGKGLGNGRGHQ
ncbi:hypothetical protein G6F31_010368 [Rhizopus arrhizus]|nr:hypothetical protein G6F31_010368 [Rhizopus arrhizus]